MPGAVYLMCLPTHFQIELACRAGRHASQYSCVSRKRERNTSQVVHPHPRCDGYRRHLGNLDRPLANWKAELLDPSSLMVVASTLTSSANTTLGTYTFANLVPGNYLLRSRVDFAL